MEEIIKQGKLEDNIYYLPDIQMDRKEYLEVAKHLKFLGGKWNKGKGGFIFDREIENIDELIGDNTKKQKELQFFETPQELAKELVELSELDNYVAILEPSAGRGAIIKEIKKVCSRQIQYCEIDKTNIKYLDEIDNLENVSTEGDFLKFNDMTFDRIIANPPFSKNQDIDHIKHMYSLLRNKGILVSIASKHWQSSNNKKETEFKQWLEDVQAEIIELETGRFKESSTNISSVIVRIIKK